MMNRIANLFPVWVLLAGALAYVRPGWFTWFDGSYIVAGLAIIMLGMGITLSFDDFKRALRMPRAIAWGLVAQFTIMPLAGWSVAKALHLPVDYQVGLILVACCPGGTASNVVTFIARANVALSVLMTMCSTFAAIVATPLLTRALAGTLVPVNAWGLFWSTVQVVLLPVAAGLILNSFAPRLVTRVLPIAPVVSVAAIAMICGSIIGKSADELGQSGPLLLLAVSLVHLIGFALGYVFTRILGYGELVARTVSIEVGMQNSGLAAVLASRHFAPATALPCAISATMHSVIGSILAGIWRVRPTTAADENKPAASPPPPVASSV